MGRAVAWLTAAMVVVTVVVVGLRYGLATSSIFLQESVMYMHGAVLMLGISYALKENRHVRVDIFYARMSERRQALVDVTGHLLFLLPVSLLIFWTSLPYVANAWRVLEGSSEVGGVPAVFLLKTLIPIMALLLGLQGLNEIVRGVQRLRQR
ncbi:MAG: TRAP transporter small permease subunit [Candidatus Tectomicrobia bacterium]